MHVVPEMFEVSKCVLIKDVEILHQGYFVGICMKHAFLITLVGKKSDVWLAIDPITGTKLHTISNDGVVSSTCPVADTLQRAIYIARTGMFIRLYV